ncbi:MAG: type II secretion system protein [Planctomycetota bacterium]
MFYKRNAFTLIELLVAISIIALLIGLLMPVLGNAKTHAKMIREMSAARTLMVAYSVYTNDHNGYVLPGYWNGDARDDRGNTLHHPASTRYAWRLAPYMDYQIRDGLLVHSRQADIESLIAQGASYAYEVSTLTSLGLNARHIGGHQSYAWLPYVRRIEEPTEPSRLITFASARSTPSGAGDEVEGYFEVTPPEDPTYDAATHAYKYGFVHPRYHDSAVVGWFDTHASVRPEQDFQDMRRWSDVAARQNDPAWVWTP